MGPSSESVGAKILTTLSRRENTEALRHRPSCIDRNANQCTKNERRANPDGNEAPSSTLTNLYSDPFVSERIANRRLATVNFPFGSRFALEGSLLEPTTPVFRPRD